MSTLPDFEGLAMFAKVAEERSFAGAARALNVSVATVPEFMCADEVRAGRLVPILRDWTLPRGGLYFVTPSARTRPAKIEALSAFFVQHLSAPSWRLVDQDRTSFNKPIAGIRA